MSHCQKQEVEMEGITEQSKLCDGIKIHRRSVGFEQRPDLMRQTFRMEFMSSNRVEGSVRGSQQTRNVRRNR